jgi:hypothetical protein
VDSGRNIARVFALAIPVLVAIAAVNMSVDPAHLFRGPALEKEAAALLATGNNVGGVGACDDRLLQRYVAEARTEAPQTLVLGSSRTLCLSAKGLELPSLYNASVTEATLEDHEALLEIYAERDLLPKRLILGVDPWAFNADNGLDGWLSLEQFQKAFSSRAGRADNGRPSRDLFSSLGRMSQAFSPSYLQASLEELSHRASSKGDGRNQGEVWVAETEEGEEPIRHPDGSISYGKSFRERSSATARAEAIAYASKFEKSFRLFSLVRPEWMQRFEDLLAFCRDQDIEVVLLLCPYHPQTFAGFLESPGLRMGEDAESLTRRLAARYDLTVVGSYDPTIAGVGEDDFLDALHLRPEAANRLVRQWID